MSSVAVDIQDVSKRFRLYHEKYRSIKERVIHAGRNPYEEFWALRDVGFEVAEGETIGVLGRNGSGKSTLLKCVSGILQPTSGRVLVRGQLAALLELGAGFQPDLSGRDNIFLNASLLGLSTKEVEKRFPEIVAFAELEQFIDNQVKYYSSGMFVRLGFAVAVNVDPDILVIDEVLAVGDEKFQRKCLERIKQFQDDGRTILFVTHASETVRQICDRAVVLDAGRVVGIGTPGEAIRIYGENLLDSGTPEAVEDPGHEPTAEHQAVGARRRIEITGIDLEHPGSGSRPHMFPGESLVARVVFDAAEPVDDVVFSIVIHDISGTLVFKTDTEILGQEGPVPSGPGRVDFTFEAVPLLDGTYFVSVGVGHRAEIFDWHDQEASFEVLNPGRATGAVAMNVHAEVRTATLS